MSEDTQWSPESMLEVSLKEPDDFLKVRETLTRIGVASRKDKNNWTLKTKYNIGKKVDETN